jgi:hypothetical protein
MDNKQFVRIAWLAIEQLQNRYENDREWRIGYRDEALEIFDSLTDKQREEMYQQYRVSRHDIETWGGY